MLAGKARDRVTVRLNGELGDAIQSIQDLTPAQSPTDVVRRALMVYYNLVQERAAGNEPVVKTHTEDGGTRNKPIFL